MTARHRTCATLAVAMVMIGVVGYLRPPIDPRQWSDEQSATMFARKLMWNSEYDLVIVGDSRVAFGVSPVVIDDGMSTGGHKTANFGFLGATLRLDYLDWAANLLHPADERRPRGLLIGVTPRSLVPTTTWQDQFTESVKLGPVGRRLQVYVKPWLTPFRRTTLSDIRHYLRPDQRANLPPVGFEWFDNGWVSARRIREGSGDGNLIQPPKEPVKPFKPVLEQELMKRVEEWTRAGIRVYAFRPPLPDDLAKREDYVYRFDEQTFVAQFTAAGGNWLNGSVTHLDCWDGSHIAHDSALELSKSLVGQIRSIR